MSFLQGIFRTNGFGKKRFNDSKLGSFQISHLRDKRKFNFFYIYFEAHYKFINAFKLSNTLNFLLMETFSHPRYIRCQKRNFSRFFFSENSIRFLSNATAIILYYTENKRSAYFFFICVRMWVEHKNLCFVISEKSSFSLFCAETFPPFLPHAVNSISWLNSFLLYPLVILCAMSQKPF